LGIAAAGSAAGAQTSIRNERATAAVNGFSLFQQKSRQRCAIMFGDVICSREAAPDLPAQAIQSTHAASQNFGAGPRPD
jgi:hypothetical protein